MNTRVLEQRRPSVEQMRELLSLGVVLAKDQSKLRRSPSERAHIFLSQEVEQIENIDEDSFKYSVHRFTGRIARTGHRRWSMRLAEAYWERDREADAVDGYRTSYSFEWTDKSVITAVKAIHVLNTEEEERLDDVQRVDGSMDSIGHWADFWGAVASFGQLSEENCAALILNVSSYGEQSRKGVLAI